MILKDFIEQYIEHNSLVRLVYKMGGGHKTVLNDWIDVSMEWEITKGSGKYASYINHEVIGIASVYIPGQYPEAINIVIKEIPRKVLREKKIDSLFD